MNCKEFKKAIDDEIKLGEAVISGELKAHLEGCRDCSAYLAQLSSLDAILKNTSPTVRPGELDDLTFDKIVSIAQGRNEKPKVIENIFKLKWAWIPAAAAAIIIAILFVPQMINKPAVKTPTTASAFYTPVDVDLEATLASSDTLTDEFLTSIAGNSSDLELANDVLMSGANINDMINGLSNNELEALYKKLQDLKG